MQSTMRRVTHIQYFRVTQESMSSRVFKEGKALAFVLQFKLTAW